MMSQLVFEATGKYINPTRYRQIIETESGQNLSPDEQKWVTEDKNKAPTYRGLTIRRKDHVILHGKESAV